MAVMRKGSSRSRRERIDYAELCSQADAFDALKEELGETLAQVLIIYFEKVREIHRRGVRLWGEALPWAHEVLDKIAPQIVSMRRKRGVATNDDDARALHEALDTWASEGLDSEDSATLKAALSGVDHSEGAIALEKNIARGTFIARRVMAHAEASGVATKAFRPGRRGRRPLSDWKVQVCMSLPRKVAGRLLTQRTLARLEVAAFGGVRTGQGSLVRSWEHARRVARRLPTDEGEAKAEQQAEPNKSHRSR